LVREFICALRARRSHRRRCGNGPGTDFTSLKAAIAAAANGDVVLMRSGVYDALRT
jgi:hypothetical protein